MDNEYYKQKKEELKKKRENMQLILSLIGITIIIFSPIIYTPLPELIETVHAVIGLFILIAIGFTHYNHINEQIRLTIKDKIDERKYEKKTTPGIRIDEVMEEIERSGI